MKCTVALALFLLQVLAREGEAVLDNVFPNNGGDPNSFDLTNILECVDDNGGRLNVPLVPPADGSDFDYWLPAQST